MQVFLFPTLTRRAGSAGGLALVAALATHSAVAAATEFRPRITTVPARVDPNSRRYDTAGRLISHIEQPMSWAATTTSPFNKVKYNLEFLGSSPSSATKSNIPLYLIAWRFEFSNGMITDARATACGDSGNHPVFDRVFNSPLLQDANFTSNGVNVGKREYIDAMQTAQFAGMHFSPNWRTNFVPNTTVWTPATVHVPSNDGSASIEDGCVAGVLNKTYLDKLLVNEIQSLQGRHGANGFVVSHSAVAFNVLNNTVVSPDQAFGFSYGSHSAYGTSSYNQVYGWGSWISEPGGDILAMSGILGEIVNDPYVKNATPAWYDNAFGGHLCSSLFEVGDPLFGLASFSYRLNGYAYDLEDLTFFGWFYREPGGGTGNKYSFSGSLTGYENGTDGCST